MCAALVLAALTLPNIARIALAEVAVPEATKAAIALVTPKKINFGRQKEGIPKTSAPIRFINKSKSALATPMTSVSGIGFGVAIN